MALHVGDTPQISQYKAPRARLSFMTGLAVLGAFSSVIQLTLRRFAPPR